MSQIITDKAGLMEPNLWVPFKQPVNFARLNPYWKYSKDLFYVYCSAVSPTLDLVSKTQGTQVGTFATIADRTGINIQPTASSSYLSTGVTTVPSEEPYNTILYVGVRPISSTAYNVFNTRRNSSNPTYFSGVFWTGTNTVLSMGYGDNTGTASSNWRYLTTTTSITNLYTRGFMSFCGCFKTSTTGSLYMNGRLMSLSAVGTGGAVAGTGNLSLYDYRNYSVYVWNPIHLLAIFNTQLPDQAMQSLSADPYQMFTPL